jgi:1-deoxy-D-xylulose-5-phosphate synthase
MPVIGKGVEEVIEKIKKSIRMVFPASHLFESLNIPYFGPVDGYDIGSLVQLFSALSELEHPAILHVYTKKGKGFEPAEQGGGRFHSTGPFKMNGDATGSEGGRKTFTEVFGESLGALAEKDDRIVAITSAMCDGTGLGEFRKRFANRFYDVGIAESAAVDIAAGLAKSGLRPVVAIYSTFLQRSFDQIVQEVALQKLPVVFCIDRAGLVGSDGPTHHGLMDIGFLRMMPHMVLTAPANGEELRLALEFALEQNCPVAVRYPKDFVPRPGSADKLTGEPFVHGKGVFAKKEKDSSIVIVSYGSMLEQSLEASRILGEEDIAVDVFNARFAAPIDEQILSFAQEGQGLITVEDHHIACGFGAGVLELLATDAGGKPESPIAILGVPRRLVNHSSRVSQFVEAGIDAGTIARTAREMLGSFHTSGLS